MGTVLAFPGPSNQQNVTFERLELNRIVDLYGRMVAAGLWRDYAIEFRAEAASFHAFRCAAEQPEYRIEKRPGQRGGGGLWALVGEAGQVLRRGPELGPVLAPIERRLMKLVGD
ncbi:DUF2794 domain-containing protein [Sphingosinicella sp.]|uniref:DUF2794 domain-containing protein n=1 Tax=Sphingosinicella sp. TaxID=1917971 RepID=UPI0040378DA3